MNWKKDEETGALSLCFLDAALTKGALDWIKPRLGKTVVRDGKRQVFLYWPQLDR